MRSRDWLVQRGLAKPGARGRFSREARVALDQALAEGIRFDDMQAAPTLVGKPIVVRSKPQAEPLAKVEPTRKENTFWVIDRAKSHMQLDIVIGFSSCDACGKAVKYCTHEEPRPPKWVSSDKIFFEKPVV